MYIYMHIYIYTHMNIYPYQSDSSCCWRIQSPHPASSHPSKHTEVQGTGFLHDDSDHHIPGTKVGLLRVVERRP